MSNLHAHLGIVLTIYFGSFYLYRFLYISFFANLVGLLAFLGRNFHADYGFMKVIILQEVKINSPDYKGIMSEEAAKEDFLKRIEMYKMQYEPIDEEADEDLSYIKVSRY